MEIFQTWFQYLKFKGIRYIDDKTMFKSIEERYDVYSYYLNFIKKFKMLTKKQYLKKVTVCLKEEYFKLKLPNIKQNINCKMHG